MRLVAFAGVVLLSSGLLCAQGTPGPGRGMGAKDTPSRPAPRNKDGRVTFGAGEDGKGFWGGGGSIVGTGRNSLPTNLSEEDIPFQDWARVMYAERRTDEGQTNDPHARCMPPGGPRQFQTPNGFEFIEDPDRQRILIIFGGGPRVWRIIWMDGRDLPPADEDRLPTYLGYSTGHWEGDTLVVESEGYNERFWFHRGGLPHTDALHLTERFSRPDFDTLVYEVTVDDPKAYTKPWSGGFTVPWTYTNWDGSEGGEIHEYFCQDNERDWQSFQ